MQEVRSVLENLEGESFDDLFSLAKENKRKAEEDEQKIIELIRVRNAVIYDLEKKYNFRELEKLSKLEEMVLEIYQFMLVFDGYIKDDTTITKDKMREKSSGFIYKMKELYEIIRDG